MATSASRPIRFTVRGPIERTDLAGLSERVCAVLAEHAIGVAERDVVECDVVECDVDGVPPDAVTVEALARLQLVARRNHCQVRLHNASPDLLQLVTLMGLTDVLPD